MTEKHHLPKVADVMTREVISVPKYATVRQAKEIMRIKSISGMPVVDRDNTMIGIISIADIIKAMEEGNLDAPVDKVMTRQVVSLCEHDTVGQALKVFRQYGYGRLPVIDDRRHVLGVLTQSDIVSRLVQILEIDKVDESKETHLSEDFESYIFEYHIQGMDFDRAGEGASTLKKILNDLGIKGSVVRRCAIVAYEAEMNVVIHAYEGKMTARVTPKEITITVDDTGPGIKDISLALKPGYSTAPDRVRKMGFGAGMGLPNIKKSADEFFIESSPQGTHLHIKIYIE
ncbi:MAG: CBS domain-containing protein [Bacillota bacterium]|uniref:CBS domain-containing protein n=1 Tax=Thermanaerosceptrum fracticalcis TaxID=1712410 RepID=A0A7G6E671_THEFR|nr:CBS domain-containing protein [Thermanaerosceptrum fracticalcis]QNB47575.1 CBS domain-containing protein [Thermanaerosceptrum fracticalcis]